MLASKQADRATTDSIVCHVAGGVVRSVDEGEQTNHTLPYGMTAI